MNSVCLQGFPFSPSVNESYRNVAKVGRVKTAIYRAFEVAVKQWALKNHDAIGNAMALLEALGPGVGIRATYTFYFKPERVLVKLNTNPKTNPLKMKKKNESKKIDVSNYLKAAEDQLCEMVGLDDCYFWQVSINKDLSPTSHEWIDVELSLYNHPTI